jgi:hypothetical protein
VRRGAGRLLGDRSGCLLTWCRGCLVSGGDGRLLICCRDCLLGCGAGRVLGDRAVLCAVGGVWGLA